MAKGTTGEVVVLREYVFVAPTEVVPTDERATEREIAALRFRMEQLQEQASRGLKLVERHPNTVGAQQVRDEALAQLAYVERTSPTSERMICVKRLVGTAVVPPTKRRNN